MSLTLSSRTARRPDGASCNADGRRLGSRGVLDELRWCTPHKWIPRSQPAGQPQPTCPQQQLSQRQQQRQTVDQHRHRTVRVHVHVCRPPPCRHRRNPYRFPFTGRRRPCFRRTRRCIQLPLLLVQVGVTHAVDDGEREEVPVRSAAASRLSKMQGEPS